VSGRYSPWRHLGRLDHVQLTFDLLPGQDGCWRPADAEVVLDRRLTQAERRSTLAHELVHAEHNDEPCACPVAGAKQERRADETAARRLITLDQLADALAWTSDGHQLADELWVDVATVHCRLATLTEAERMYVSQRIWRREESA
jgi:hypothetical protein